jgi:hypothetical protein
MLTPAGRIAIAWTLLSSLLTAFWVLLLEFARRFGTRHAAKRSAREERQLSAEVRAIYADLADVDGACSDALAHSDPDENRESDVIVFIWRSSVQKR